MNVTVEYLSHSGYVVETDKIIMIFDYVNGILPSKYLKSDKQCCFFITHHHSDHFSQSVFSYKKTVVMSDDINLDSFFNVFKVRAGDMLVCDKISVKVFGSTDEGVSFLVSDGDVNIFHAGDLNNWHWKDESTSEEIEFAQKSFLDIVAQVAEYPIDIAMFPVDARMGSEFDLGARQFVDRCQPTHFFPMHFRSVDSLLPMQIYLKNFKHINYYIPLKNNHLFEVDCVRR
jgi:L-ascorbate metabolism protein UlaG (beta-lactamase superfamily)